MSAFETTFEVRSTGRRAGAPARICVGRLPESLRHYSDYLPIRRVVGLAALVGASVGALCGAAAAGSAGTSGAIGAMLLGSGALSCVFAALALADCLALGLILEVMWRRVQTRLPLCVLLLAHMAVFCWAAFLEPSGNALLACVVVFPIELAGAGALIATARRR